MKIKKHKTFGEYPYFSYTVRIKKIKCKINLFEKGWGEFVFETPYKRYVEDDSKMEDWIRKIDKEISDLKSIKKILLEVQEHFNNNKKELLEKY